MPRSCSPPRRSSRPIWAERPSVDHVLQTAIDALSLGSLYALIALGIALIFGIMRLINFAHGEFIMVGAYAIYLLSGPPFAVVVVATLLFLAAFAVLTERIAFRPVRTADPSTLLVTSFAVSYLLQSIALVIWGSRQRGVSVPEWTTDSFAVGEVTISTLSVVTIGVTLLLMAGLASFLRRSPLGIQMRAAAEDFEMARLLGVRANTVIASAFAVSGLLAGAAAVLLVAQLASVNPAIGLTPVIIAFMATVVGGMGSMPGAVLGGYLIGCTSVILQTVLPLELRPYRDAFVFTLVIAVLVVRPQGLLVIRSERARV
jgi:branched-chain amino acid transport system permease protein